MPTYMQQANSMLPMLDAAPFYADRHALLWRAVREHERFVRARFPDGKPDGRRDTG